MAEVISSYSTGDGRNLFYRTYSPEHRSDGPCLILIHGIESHSGWYSEVGERLTGLGLTVYAMDRRGSGLNKEDRGDLDDFQRLIQDIDDFFIQKGLAKKECILIGLCWGAKPALYFFLRNPQKISRIIFVTPGFKTVVPISFIKKFKWLFALIFAPHTYFALPIEPEMFTEDRAYLDRIREDKLRLKNVTGRFLKENIRLENAIRKSKTGMDTPCLLFLAGGDEIVDNNGAIMFLKRYFRNLTIKSYSGCRHGLFFEPKKEEAIKELADWIIKR